MSMTRRRLLGAALAAPIVATLAPLLRTHAATTRALAGAVRPAPDGRSDRRCATCGAGDHAMLDAGCPARPRVR